MKKLICCAGLMALALWIQPAVAQDDAAAPAGAQEKSAVQVSSDQDKLSYSVGYQVGRSLQDLPELNIDVFVSAIHDVLGKKSPALTEKEMQDSIMAVMTKVREEQQKKMEAEKSKAEEDGAKRVEANTTWLADNAKKEGVKATASGLQYKVITEGAGAAPKPTDTVTVNYDGTLTDGTKFDSSYDRGEPATFRLDQVIKGWTEGLQLMKEGGKCEFFIPADLGYGSQFRPGSPIPPNSILHFVVELIKVEGGAGDSSEIVLPKSN